MNRRTPQALLLAAILAITLIGVEIIHAQGDSTTSVINAVNQLRVGLKLPGLLSHPDLMVIAQQHSQYQASIGTATPNGADGSSPEERAEAAGFGAGAEIHVFENESCGVGLSILEVLSGPWSEPGPHSNLAEPQAQYIGAGIAYAGDLVCYTVVTGYWVGEPEPTQARSATPGTPSSSAMPTEVPVVVATPLPDGTLRHTVAGGQTLWIIAAVYNVPLDELRALNGFSPDRVVNPGDVVVIQPSSTPTNTPIGQPSPTLPLRFTHTPSPVGFQATAVVFSPATASPTEGGGTEPRFRASAKNPTLVIAAVLISGGTLAAALVISLRSRD